MSVQGQLSWGANTGNAKVKLLFLYIIKIDANILNGNIKLIVYFRYSARVINYVRLKKCVLYYLL